MLRAFLITFALSFELHAGALLFSDDFKDGLATGWKWIREDSTAWRSGPRGLEILLQSGNMWGPENSGRNILVRNLPPSEKPLEISMIVENKPTEQYEQVDLVAYFDDSHMVKIGQELVDGKLSIVMGREERDKTRTLAILPLAKSRVALKLRIFENQVSGFFRPEGEEEWKKAGECDLPRPGPPKIAIQCYQGAREKEHWATIQSFRIATGSD